MATTKKTTIIESDEAVVEQRPAQVMVETKEGVSKQNIVTMAIVSAVVLFFIGLGLGYLLGHSTADTRGNRQFPTMDRDGDTYFNQRRGMMNQNDTNSNSSSSSTQTTPQTQAN